MTRDLAVAEAEIGRIPDVLGVRIVTDDDGRPVEVHVLASVGKQPKQLVRDVQSVALTAAGIDLDRRIVSVVQLEDPPHAEPTAGRAPLPSAVDGVVVARRHDRLEVTVELATAGGVVCGSASGTPRDAIERIAAEAAVAAVRSATPDGSRLLLADARRVPLAGSDAVVVALRRGDAVAVGSSLAADGVVEEAAARAVVDAAERQPAHVRA